MGVEPSLSLPWNRIAIHCVTNAHVIRGQLTNSINDAMLFWFNDSAKRKRSFIPTEEWLAFPVQTYVSDSFLVSVVSSIPTWHNNFQSYPSNLLDLAAVSLPYLRVFIQDYSIEMFYREAWRDPRLKYSKAKFKNKVSICYVVVCDNAHCHAGLKSDSSNANEQSFISDADKNLKPG